MRERVCIVLNERESTKEKAANSLEEKLREADITASRIEIDKHIVDVICERYPEVLVLDYLIGDYSTGLDIQAAVNAKKVGEHVSKPKIVFLTDEPSVPVAVEALKNGAVEYIELDNPQAVQNTARVVAELLKEQ